VLATALFETTLKPRIDRMWVSLVPLFAEQSGWSLSGALACVVFNFERLE
jgi:hypothetical protein